MSRPLSVCVVTSSRADYSHLYYPIKAIDSSPKLDLQLVATGMHMSEQYGNTIAAIENDGFTVTRTANTLTAGNDTVAITKSIGQGAIEFADIFADIKPDIVMVLGDRYEILPVVQAALIAQIPVAHICGGDVTEGAFDDAIRHSITKMSHIHFTSNEESQRRVLQMGENPEQVYNVGAPSLDIINNMSFMSQDDLLNKVGLDNGYGKYVLLTYHPETLAQRSPEEDVQIVLDSLSTFDNTGIIITGANADIGGEKINQQLQNYANDNDNSVFHMSLGKELFYNSLKHMDVFVGNSSSGLYEAPSFKLPVVNIGDRQKSRTSAASVINCDLDKEQIISAINNAFTLECNNVVSPFGDGTASQQIVAILESIKNPKDLLQKKFFNYGT